LLSVADFNSSKGDCQATCPENKISTCPLTRCTLRYTIRSSEKAECLKLSQDD
jgi:hypothetical protein